MPRLSTIQTDFTAGELSPRVHGRVDIDKYNHGAKGLTNCHPVVHGGCVRRAGTRYVQPQKDSSVAGRLVPFVVDRDTSYMLELGNGFVRIFQPNGVYTGIELVAPYTTAMLADLDYTQASNAMFLWSQLVFPQRLRRIAVGVWDLSSVPYTVQPFDELGHVFSATCTLGATTGSTTATASSSVFLPSDVGRNLISGAGVAAITGYTSGTVVNVTISSAFSSVSLASAAWYLDLSPQAFLWSTSTGPAGTAVTLTGASTRAATLTLAAATGSGITVTASAGVFVPGDAGLTLVAGVGVATIATYTDATHVVVDITSDFPAKSFVSGSWAIDASTFRTPDDVGKYVRLNDGVVKITAVSSATKATGTVVVAMSSLTAAPPLAWSMEQPMWNATNGYPRTGTIHQQRLWCAGAPRYPQTMWGSRSGLYLDYTKGAKDADACIFEIASDEVNPITYLATAKDMMVQTYGGEFSARAPQGKAITPSAVDIEPETPYGSRNVRPLTVGRECLFVERSGLRLRAMGYQFAIDGYDADDLTQLAEHITASGITSMCFAKSPDNMVWLTLADGTLLSLTIDRRQNVQGWAKHYTDGAVEWVASMPVGTVDQVWMLVRRTVNGATVRYIEYLDATFAPIYPVATDPLAMPPIAQPTVYGCTVDAGVAFDNASGQSSFSVPHLIGKTVDIVADGLVQAQQVVPMSGIVTLGRLAYRTLIGLHFESKLEMLTPEVGTGTGTAQGNSMRTAEITLSVLNTYGATITDGDGNVQDVPFSTFGPLVLDQAPHLYTGTVRLEAAGWERGQSAITISQRLPLPMHIRNVVRKFTVND